MGGESPLVCLFFPSVFGERGFVEVSSSPCLASADTFLPTLTSVPSRKSSDKVLGPDAKPWDAEGGTLGTGKQCSEHATLR